MAEASPGANIGRNVRSARERKLFSRADLAERSGVSLAGIDHLERGLSARPRRRTIEKLAEALEVDVDSLMEEAASPLAQAPSSQRSLFNGGDEERRYRPTTQDEQALNRYLSRLQQELDEDRMRRGEVERELDIVRAFGPAVFASMSGETADLILVLGRRLLEKAKEMNITEDAETEAVVTETDETEAVVTRLEEWREREAS